MDVFQNKFLICGILGWFVAQIIKIIISLITRRGFDFGMFFASGGMPSSHSSTVCSMTALAGAQYGLASSFFAICAVFSFIVMYDACGVRRAAGEQAKILNKILRDISQGKRGEFGADLKELIGHTPFQVFVGGLLGIVIGLTVHFHLPL